MTALSQGMKTGLREGAIVGLTAALLGIMYSLAALEAGLSALEAVFYSAVVYSAAVQFAALGAETTPGAARTLLPSPAGCCGCRY